MTPSTRHHASKLLGALLGSVVIVAALAVFAPNAFAATPAHPSLTTQQWTAREVQALLAQNPGSRQVDVDSVEVAAGVLITARPYSASGRCHGGYVCLFWNSDFRGDQITLGPYNGCGYYNLHNYYGSNGHSWADEASSIDNPEPRPNPPARFAHEGKYVFSVAGGHYYKNLANDYGSNGHVMNDYITNVRTC